MEALDNLVVVSSADSELNLPVITIPEEIQDVFDEVTVSVPTFLMNTMDSNEHLTLLMKLAENLNVSILMRSDIKDTETQTFSYQGSLKSILEIEHRLCEHAGILSTKQACQVPQLPLETVSVATNTENKMYADCGTHCVLLDDPKFSRSGRLIKRRQSISYLYEDADKLVILNSKKLRSEKDDKTNGDKNYVNLIKARKKKVGRKKKIIKKESVSAADSVKDSTERVQEAEDCGGDFNVEENVRKVEGSDESKDTEKKVSDSDTDAGKSADKNFSKKQKTEADDDITGDDSVGKTQNMTKISLEDIKQALKKTKNPSERKRLQKIVYEMRTPWKYRCTLCSYRTKRESHYKKHLVVHETKNPTVYSCDNCDFKTIRSARMTMHVEERECTLSGVPRKTGLSCPLCTAVVATSKKDLAEHLSIEHGVNDNSLSGSMLTCQYCDYITDRPRRLDRHMSVHESVENPKEYTNTFTCPHCDYSTNKKALLRFHVKDRHTVTLRTLCDLCGASFKRKHSLKMHRKFVHTDGQSLPLPFMCKICTKKFRSRAHLREHEVTHTNLRSFLCETCGSGFKTKSAVKRHVLTVHSDTKKHECHKCTKKFATEASLIRHFKAGDGKCRPDVKTDVYSSKINNELNGEITSGGNLPLEIVPDQNISNLVLADGNQVILDHGQGIKIHILPQPITSVNSIQDNMVTVDNGVVDTTVHYGGDSIIQDHVYGIQSEESNAIIQGQYINQSDGTEAIIQGQFVNQSDGNEAIIQAQYINQSEAGDAIIQGQYGNHEVIQYSEEVGAEYNAAIIEDCDNQVVEQGNRDDKVVMVTGDSGEPLSFW